jgi:hypothetical protein
MTNSKLALGGLGGQEFDPLQRSIDMGVSLNGLKALGMADKFHGRMQSLIPDLAKPQDIEEAKQQQQQRLEEVLAALGSLDEPSYRELVALSKGLTTPMEIFKRPELHALSLLLSKAAGLMDALPDDRRAPYEMNPVASPAKRYPFADELVVLSRLYCPKMGVNMANPESLPDVPSAFEASEVTGIRFMGDINCDIHLTYTGGGILLRSAGVDPRILQPGKQLTIGRGFLKGDAVFGVKSPSREAVIRHSDFVVTNQFVSRASLTVALDPTGKFLTVRDCGTRNNVEIIKGKKKVIYNPDIMQSMRD